MSREVLQMALAVLKGCLEHPDAQDSIIAIEHELAQPEQEPVEDVVAYHSDGTRTVRIAPKRPWVGLTDEEIKAFDTWHDNREEEVGWCNPSEIVAYIDAKLKEKNA